MYVAIVVERQSLVHTIQTLCSGAIPLVLLKFWFCLETKSPYVAQAGPELYAAQIGFEHPALLPLPPEC